MDRPTDRNEFVQEEAVQQTEPAAVNARYAFDGAKVSVGPIANQQNIALAADQDPNLPDALDAVTASNVGSTALRSRFCPVKDEVSPNSICPAAQSAAADKAMIPSRDLGTHEDLSDSNKEREATADYSGAKPVAHTTANLAAGYELRIITADLSEDQPKDFPKPDISSEPEQGQASYYDNVASDSGATVVPSGRNFTGGLPPEGPLDGWLSDDGEESWETNVSLAAALAHRYETEIRLDNKAAYGYDRLGPRDALTVAFTAGFERGLANIFLRQLEDPTASIDGTAARGLAEAIVTGNTIKAVLTDWDALHPDRPPLSLKLDDTQRAKFVDLLRGPIGDGLARLVDSGMLDQASQEYQRLMPSLREIAKQHEVALPDVLRDDNFYAESVRAVFGDADNYAQARLEAGNREFYTNQVVAVLSMTAVGKAKMLGDTRSEQEILEEARQSPKWQAMVDSTIEPTRKVYLLITADRIRRFWGEAGLASLSPGTKQALQS